MLDIWEFVAETNQVNAERLIKIFIKKFDMLLKHPFMGRERSEMFIGLPSFPAGNHIIFYQPMDYGIEILRVKHSRADLTGIFEV